MSDKPAQASVGITEQGGKIYVEVHENGVKKPPIECANMGQAKQIAARERQRLGLR